MFSAAAKEILLIVDSGLRDHGGRRAGFEFAPFARTAEEQIDGEAIGDKFVHLATPIETLEGLFAHRVQKRKA